MKTIFSKRKIIFVFSLIFVTILFPLNLLSSPGIRTYLGNESENDYETNQEASQEIYQEPLEQINNEEPPKYELSNNDINEINKIILTKKNLSETEISNIYNQSKSIEELKSNLSELDNSSMKNSREVSETAASYPPIISHEGIPLKWEYKQ